VYIKDFITNFNTFWTIKVKLYLDNGPIHVPRIILEL